MANTTKASSSISGKITPTQTISGKIGPTPQPPVSDHSKLINRNLPNQHPISAITGLINELTNLSEEIKKRALGLYHQEVEEPGLAKGWYLTSKIDDQGQGTKDSIISGPYDLGGSGTEQQVLFYENYTKFPQPGSINKLYIAKNTAKQYIWDATPGNAHYEFIGIEGKEIYGGGAAD